MKYAPFTRLMGAGSLFFAVWGLARPTTLARRMGIRSSGARQVGVREAVIGTLLVVRPGPTSLGGRALADLSDSVQTWSHDKRVAAGSIAFATTAVSLAVAARARGAAL